MRTLILLFIIGLSFLPHTINAQTEEHVESVKQLQVKKEEIVNQEKEALKLEVLAINK